jgi:hypothetical protein
MKPRGYGKRQDLFKHFIIHVIYMTITFQTTNNRKVNAYDTTINNKHEYKLENSLLLLYTQRHN